MYVVRYISTIATIKLTIIIKVGNGTLFKNPLLARLKSNEVFYTLHLIMEKK